jgi:hypothetical protein
MKNPSARISARQHLVLGLIDASEDEIAPSESRFDALTVLTAFAIALAVVTLVWAMRP